MQTSSHVILFDLSAAISVACFGGALRNTGVPGLLEGQREKDHLTRASVGQYLLSVDLKAHHLTRRDLRHHCHFSRGKLRHKVGKDHLYGLVDNQRQSQGSHFSSDSLLCPDMDQDDLRSMDLLL